MTLTGFIEPSEEWGWEIHHPIAASPASARPGRQWCRPGPTAGQRGQVPRSGTEGAWFASMLTD